MKKIVTLALIIAIALQAPASIMALEQKQKLTPEKQNFVRRLVAQYKGIRALRRKRKAGKASLEDLKKLDDQMRAIKRRAIKGGVIAAFVAAIIGGVVYAGKKAKTSPEKDLLIAARFGPKETVGRLLEEGIDPDVKDKHGYTALTYAVESHYTDAVKLLLEKGADPNTTDKDGYTILMKAALNGYPDAVKLLLEKGADPNTKNFRDQTAIDIAKTREIKFLIQGEIDVRKGLAYKVLETLAVDVPDIQESSDIKAEILQYVFPDISPQRQSSGKLEE